MEWPPEFVIQESQGKCVNWGSLFMTWNKLIELDSRRSSEVVQEFGMHKNKCDHSEINKKI